MVRLEDYDYDLPKEMIAQEVFRPRDHCKLLVLRDGIEHKKFFEVVDYFDEGDVLVLNETKVSAAKLVGQKSTGGKVEVILTGEKDGVYEGRIKGSKIKEGTELVFGDLKGVVVKRDNDIFFIKFDNKLDKKNLIVPTPPYVKKEVPEEDYQTVYAKEEGSLAAPTAGLHFTEELLEKIKAKGVKIAKIKLDISYETFLPVRDIESHSTGKEAFEIDAKNAAIINSGKIIAVGTTVVKCLESADWENRKVLPSKGVSEIFIKPGHEFKSDIKAMITNFHLPKSSLLLLAAAYAGRERILAAYEEAVRKNYRFYSLGDAMMIFKQKII
ncbi:tRNA preQ1(34) S-adenosylmethionine ribosyltransferase-isomerase QueA [Candidatus Woesearchaeota archaeon]|nr:tRNA preQ1(34) S-adenosylmethionine ribosyltransferase-isomerase QueA [Candidatus Woesearchaeota archaeon]